MSFNLPGPGSDPRHDPRYMEDIARGKHGEMEQHMARGALHVRHGAGLRNSPRWQRLAAGAFLAAVGGWLAYLLIAVDVA